MKVKNEEIDDSTRDNDLVNKNKPINKVGWPTEIVLLFDCEMKQLRRDKMAIVVRVGSTGFFGLSILVSERLIWLMP
jgi:hypothetical protein